MTISNAEGLSFNFCLTSESRDVYLGKHVAQSLVPIVCDEGAPRHKSEVERKAMKGFKLIKGFEQNRSQILCLWAALFLSHFASSRRKLLGQGSA